MPIALACACGAAYSVKDEFAGVAMQCPKCKGALQAAAGSLAAAPAAAPQAGHPAFQRDKFLLAQKHFAINEKYTLSDEQGNALLFVERPTHLLRSLLAIAAGIAAAALTFGALTLVIDTLRGPMGAAAPWLYMLMLLVPLVGAIAGTAASPLRHVTFYVDEGRTQKALEVSQDQRFVLFTATFTVREPGGAALAVLSKNHLHNLLRKKWRVLRPDGALWSLVMEDSILLSLLRRFLGPMYGLLRTNFIFCRGDSDEVVGEFNRKMTILDRYVLDMSADRERLVDRRVAAALGVLLDTAEKR